jgi:hypothetical protein
VLTRAQVEACWRTGGGRTSKGWQAPRAVQMVVAELRRGGKMGSMASGSYSRPITGRSSRRPALNGAAQ